MLRAPGGSIGRRKVGGGGENGRRSRGSPRLPRRIFPRALKYALCVHLRQRRAAVTPSCLWGEEGGGGGEEEGDEEAECGKKVAGGRWLVSRSTLQQLEHWQLGLHSK